MGIAEKTVGPRHLEFITLTPAPRSTWRGGVALARMAISRRHQAQRPRVFFAEEQVQVRVASRTPIAPPALPIGPPEVAHALAENLDGMRTVFLRPDIENELRAATRAKGCAITRSFGHGLDSFLDASLRKYSKPKTNRQRTAPATLVCGFTARARAKGISENNAHGNESRSWRRPENPSSPDCKSPKGHYSLFRSAT
jgi:hypothetical protein